ncbi:MarR family transcriptional regulator [Deinococcus puniceus]|uniref:Uncharacterized protein n=1 Tax=Deinococcus puniceus TaxID=1182568 RepID=A0A172TBP7_9DEIO|nr:MarR family transcriptional regulator [Deinococcus puniceus]ANE44354.1 hypothetical protein SU48_11935 [Deinococcus puniceus]
MDKSLPAALRPLPATCKLVWLYIHQYPGYHSVRSLEAALGSTAGRALPNLLQAGLLVQEEAPVGRRSGKYRTAYLPEQSPPSESSVAVADTVLASNTVTRPNTVLAEIAVGALHSDSNFSYLHHLWQRANDSGVRRVVLQLEAESPIYADDDNKLNVRVLDTEHWPNWSSLDDEQTRAVAKVIARRAELDTFLTAALQKKMERVTEQRNRMGFWFLEDTKQTPVPDPEQMN